VPAYSSLTTSTPSGGGPSTILVKVLQDYDRQLPLDFVAMILGRTRTEVEQDVAGLEKQGVARRLGNEVVLVR
jgi:hypothetical protein